MTETVVPDAMVSPAVGGYGERPGGPAVDFSYVGIDAILEQMRRKAMKQGFELNIMVVGKSGVFIFLLNVPSCYPDLPFCFLNFLLTHQITRTEQWEVLKVSPKLDQYVMQFALKYLTLYQH